MMGAQATLPVRPPTLQAHETRSRRVRSGVRRVWGVVARVWWVVSGWVPLTPLGFLVVPLSVLTWQAFGGEQTDVIVRTMCAGGVILLAVDILAVLATAGWLAIRREPAIALLSLEVGFPTRTGYRLGLVRWNPLTRVAVEWEDPPATVEWVSARGGWEEQVVAVARGEATQIRRCFTVTDLFGLSRIRVRRRGATPVVARPYQGRPSAYDIRELFQAGDRIGRPTGVPDGDLIEMKRYVPGDPLKLVLWKVYARTGTMLVRAPEKAVDPTERTLAYLVAAEADEPVAGLARLALEQGLLGPAVIFSADGAPGPARTTAEGVEQIVRSVQHRATGGSDLDRFLNQGASGGSGACVLFVSHRPGPWLARVVAALGRHSGPFRAVIGVDGKQLAADSRRLGHLVFRPPVEGSPRARDILAVCAALRGVGAEVLVLDRQTGEQIAGIDTFQASAALKDAA